MMVNLGVVCYTAIVNQYTKKMPAFGSQASWVKSPYFEVPPVASCSFHCMADLFQSIFFWECLLYS